MLHVFINYADTSRVKKTVLALACILSFSQVHAIEIDIPFMKESAQRDKQDIDSRILLMKHYTQSPQKLFQQLLMHLQHFEYMLHLMKM